MKKLIAFIGISSVLVFALSGCGSAQSAASSATATSAEASAAVSAESSAEQADIANPWSDVASAEEAAASAGLGGFVVPLGSEISLGALDLEHTSFRAMKSLAEANVEFFCACLIKSNSFQCYRLLCFGTNNFCPSNDFSDGRRNVLTLYS